MGMPRVLVLVRHDFSEPNAVQRRIKQEPGYEAPEGFYDRHDSEMRLMPEDYRSLASGEFLRKEHPDGFDAYFVSPLTRAVETAGRLALRGNWKINDLIRERDWGEYGVLNDVERQAKFEISHRLKKQNKWYWAPAGGESLATGVRLRLEAHRNTLRAQYDGKRVIEVMHGETLDTFKFIIENQTPQLWLAQDRDPNYAVKNCQILEYSRTNPHTGVLEDEINWRRSTCAWDPKHSWNEGEWVQIERKTYSDEQLLDIAEQFPRLLNDEKPTLSKPEEKIYRLRSLLSRLRSK